MDRVLLFLSALAAFFILCQWFVCVSVRKYLFQRYNPVTRKVAYSVLGLLGLANLLSLKSAYDLFPPDSWENLAASVAYFSYLGCVLLLCIFFLALGGVSQVLRLKDAVVSAINSRRSHTGDLSRGKAGCVSPVGCKAKPVEVLREQKSLAGCKAEPGSCQPEEPAMAAAQLKPVPSSYGLSSTRRSFLKWTTAAGLVAAAGYAGHGIAEAYARPIIEEFDLYYPELEGLTRPLTFIQITDFHFGMFLGSPELERLVQLVNALDGDAMLITGDVFHSPLTRVELATPILKKLKPRRLGNFAVLGNHDFYTGESLAAQSLKDSGLTLLRHQWITFREGSANIHLGGIDDPMVNWVWGSQFPKFEGFMTKAPTSPGMRILLSHRPSVLPVASQAGIDFVLSGHIHGGQIIFPYPGRDRGLSIARVASPFTHGWYRIGKSRMYLNRGIGLTFVPWRINCPAEITLFHLHPAGNEKTGVRRSLGNQNQKI
jgi:predicted MPP superfamily phosphohydrolase